MAGVYEKYRDYINWSIGITLFVAAFLLSKDEIVGLYQTNIIKGILSSLLLATTVLWYFLYLSAVRNELDLLNSSIYADKIKQIDGQVLPIAVGLSVLFGCLIAFSTNILIYSSLAIFLSLCDLWGGTNVNKNVAIFMMDKIYKQEEENKEFSVLFEYYFYNPLFLRIGIILLMLMTALTLSLSAKFTTIKYLEYISYVILIATILISEFLIVSWRKIRDKKLIMVKEEAEKNTNETSTQPVTQADN